MLNNPFSFLYRFAISGIHFLCNCVLLLLLYHTFLTNLGALYLTEFLTDFGQILDSNSYDQAQQTS